MAKRDLAVILFIDRHTNQCWETNCTNDVIYYTLQRFKNPRSSIAWIVTEIKTRFYFVQWLLQQKSVLRVLTIVTITWQCRKKSYRLTYWAFVRLWSTATGCMFISLLCARLFYSNVLWWRRILFKIKNQYFFNYLTVIFCSCISRADIESLYVAFWMQDIDGKGSCSKRLLQQEQHLLQQC